MRYIVTEWCKHDYGVDTCPYCSEAAVTNQTEQKIRYQQEVERLKKLLKNQDLIQRLTEMLNEPELVIKLIDKDEQVYLTQRQADYIKAKLASGIKIWNQQLVSTKEFLKLQDDDIQSWVLEGL